MNISELKNVPGRHPPEAALIYLYGLWDKLADVPTDENDCLDEPFHKFTKGTPCVDVWAWFEDQSPLFIVGEVQQGIRKI